MESMTAGDSGQPGGGSQGSTAPLGTVPSGGGQSSVPAAEPSVLDLSDENALIRVKGSDKPVKFGEHVRGFQAQWTKAAQEASRLKKELATERAQRQQYEQQRQASQQQGQQGPDVFDDLRKLPYLTGEDAVQVVQGIASQIRQRDMVTMAVLKKLEQMQQMVGTLHNTHTNSSFEAKISKWLQDGGYPAEASELAKDIYLAYEGDDLDQEFPRIFAERWGQVEKLMEARRQQKVRAAKPAPFVPGRGGQTGPTQPLQLKANASAAEIADKLWGNWNPSET